jgi:orotidine-5'-phosphate decarboxylase
VLDSLWDRIILALDTDSEREVERWLSSYPEIRHLKVGLELFCACGGRVVEKLKERGYWIFLDLKLHDIPRTLERTARVLLQLPVDMMTVHILAGREGIRALVALRDALHPSLKMVGVTLLTSLDEEGFKELFPRSSLRKTVLRLAEIGRKEGLDGVVASGEELDLLRKNFGPDMLIVVPGVRFPGEMRVDQKRTMDPREAIERGATYVVMGRSLTTLEPEKVRRYLVGPNG